MGQGLLWRFSWCIQEGCCYTPLFGPDLPSLSKAVRCRIGVISFLDGYILTSSLVYFILSFKPESVTSTSRFPPSHHLLRIYNLKEAQTSVLVIAFDSE